MPGPVHWHHTPWPKRGDWVQGSIRADAELWPDWAKRWQVDWLGMSIMSREVWFWLDSFGLAACKSNHRLIDNTANICQISRFLWFAALVYSYGSQQVGATLIAAEKGPVIQVQTVDGEVSLPTVLFLHIHVSKTHILHLTIHFLHILQIEELVQIGHVSYEWLWMYSMQSKLSNFKRGPSQKTGATSPITTEQGGTLSSYTNRFPGAPQCCQSEWGHVGTKGCGSLWEKWKHGTYRLTTFFQNCQCFELFPLRGCQQMWLGCLNFWPSDTSSAASCSTKNSWPLQPKFLAPNWAEWPPQLAHSIARIELERGCFKQHR